MGRNGKPPTHLPRRARLPGPAWRRGAAIAAVLVLAGCARPDRERVTIAGSTAFLALAERLADAFRAQRPDLRVSVQATDSAAAIQAVRSGVTHIGVADTVSLPREAVGLQAVEVARDGIAIVVNPANTVTNLTLGQVRAVFGGKLRRWKELGGGDGPVNVTVREPGSGTRISFEQLVGDVGRNANVVMQDTSGAMVQSVASDVNAIGYVSHGVADARVSDVRVDGVRCDADTMAAGRYALVRPIRLLTRDNSGPAAAAFVEFVLSPEGQRIVRDNGLVPAR